jgi:hypothetical protein
MMSYFATHALYKLKMKTSHYLVLTCIIAVFSACKDKIKKQNPWNKRIYLQMN